MGFMAVGIDIGQPFKAGLTRLGVGGLVEDLKRQIDEIAQTEVRQLIHTRICRQLSQIRTTERTSDLWQSHSPPPKVIVQVPRLLARIA